jgi:hypothetical protein
MTVSPNYLEGTLIPTFDPTAFGVAAPLLKSERLPDLGPGRPNLAAKPLLQALTPQKLFPSRAPDPQIARACLAGLWLWHDFLDESHEISQEIAAPFGSYWHGIMHRREPDYGNAKYWFRRVGTHPVFEPLAEFAEGLGFGKKPWDPFAFVDQCERHNGMGNATETMLCQIQRCEWQLLFAWCWRQATNNHATAT